jgi:alpha-amylase
MGVIMQAFYWDCPRIDGKEFEWWNHVKSEIPALKATGFTALWLPPASKAANIGGMSMGYDVYDYYDLGKYSQKAFRTINNKDEVRTWFGSEEELRSLLKAAHAGELKVYADLVLNHNNGADAEELNPITNKTRWTRFLPQSGLFTRDWTCFNPSPYPNPDSAAFGDMPDLCHINPRVSGGILGHAKWLIEEIGFDGFRYDFVKGFGAWIVRAIHDRTYTRGGKPVEVFGVGECWAGDDYIDEWLDGVNRWSAHRVGAFDFPLRYRLKDLCDSYGFSLRRLVDRGVLMKERPFEAVTFVDNHDFRGDDNPGIVNDKLLAYAFILTHEGYPCVFWQDYYKFGLARAGEKDGIAALVRAHEDHAGGETCVLYVDDNLYIMQRSGIKSQKGLIFVMNNRGDAWNGGWVRTQWKNTKFVPAAWGGRDETRLPQEVRTEGDGWAEFYAPPRGYAVYVPRD